MIIHDVHSEVNIVNDQLYRQCYGYIVTNRLHVGINKLHGGRYPGLVLRTDR